MVKIKTTNKTKPKSKTKTKNTSEDVEKGQLLFTADGTENATINTENSMQISQKIQVNLLFDHLCHS